MTSSKESNQSLISWIHRFPIPHKSRSTITENWTYIVTATTVYLSSLPVEHDYWTQWTEFSLVSYYHDIKNKRVKQGFWTVVLFNYIKGQTEESFTEKSRGQVSMFISPVLLPWNNESAAPAANLCMQEIPWLRKKEFPRLYYDEAVFRCR